MFFFLFFIIKSFNLFIKIYIFLSNLIQLFIYSLYVKMEFNVLEVREKVTFLPFFNEIWVFFNENF